MKDPLADPRWTPGRVRGTALRALVRDLRGRQIALTCPAEGPYLTGWLDGRAVLSQPLRPGISPAEARARAADALAAMARGAAPAAPTLF